MTFAFARLTTYLKDQCFYYLGYIFLTLGRNVDIPIIVVKQGFEPPHFKAYFGAWDPDVWPKNSSEFQDMKELKLADISDDISGT